MTASILKLPVVKKRGRKVTKGPKASVSLICEPDLPSNDTSLLSHKERLEELAMRIAERAVEKRRQWKAFLAASHNVIEYPAHRRFRSVAEVDELKREEA